MGDACARELFFRERGQKWLVKFYEDLCGIEFGLSNHKKVYDCIKKMNKKAVTIVAAFLLSDGGSEMVNNVIVVRVAG
jgi:hypothetical protein